MTPRRQQQGAALIVGLVLLMVLTVLGVSGMNTAALELTISNTRPTIKVAALRSALHSLWPIPW